MTPLPPASKAKAMNTTSVPAARAARRHRLFALAFLLVVAAALWLPFPHETPPPAVSTPVLVVLPLHAAGANARPQMLLADAVGRDLIGEFAHVDGLRVIDDGLKADDSVVVAGVLRAIPGQKVDPQAQAAANTK